MIRACLTVDVEPDCPPYLHGWRGIEEGLPKLLALLDAHRVPATFFTTGEAALRFPDGVRRLVEAGHEVGCHGHTHRAFTAMDAEDAREELVRSTGVLRRLAPVTSFRAPYLRFPGRYLPLLEQLGFSLDSSQGRYKPDYLRRRARTSLLRVPASVTSSALRLPARVRDPYLAVQRSPLVLFVHPWEFVDLSAEPIPWHCRMGTGGWALDSLDAVLRTLALRGARFSRMDALVPGGAAPA
jgi:peptidoglycan/xylan/chitin deacetylase (PgdA/CDA1 family)